MSYYLVTVFKRENNEPTRKMTAQFDSGFMDALKAFHFFLKKRKDSDYLYLDYIK